jgi:hypothetical protein
MHDLSWSKREKQIAHAAFERALARESAALLAEIKERALALTQLDDVWKLEHFIKQKRQAVAERYDFRYSVLLYVFADLIHAGFLEMEELDGLGEDKIARLSTMLALAGDSAVASGDKA